MSFSSNSDSYKTQNNSFFNHIYYAGLEVVQISGASLIVHKCAMHVFSNMPHLFEDAYDCVVTAPIFEELLFRTLLQGGIRNIQHYSFKWIRGREATDEEKESQKTFRVWTTGVAFGLVHALNPHKKILSKIIQVTSTTFGGVAYGYVKEATGSTGVTILCHSVSNFIVMCSIAGFIAPPFAIVAVTTMDISLYLFARNSKN